MRAAVSRNSGVRPRATSYGPAPVGSGRRDATTRRRTATAGDEGRLVRDAGPTELGELSGPVEGGPTELKRSDGLEGSSPAGGAPESGRGPLPAADTEPEEGRDGGAAGIDPEGGRD